MCDTIMPKFGFPTHHSMLFYNGQVSLGCKGQKSNLTTLSQKESLLAHVMKKFRGNTGMRSNFSLSKFLQYVHWYP